MNYCRKCGALLWKDAKFCVECGTKIEYIMPAEESAEPVEVQPEEPAVRTAVQEETKERSHRWWLAGLIAVVLAFMCGAGGWYLLHREQVNPIAGKWQAASGQLLTIELKSDGTGYIDNPAYGAEQDIKWSASENRLILTTSVYGVSSTYEYQIDGDILKLVNADNPDEGLLTMKRKKK